MVYRFTAESLHTGVRARMLSMPVVSGPASVPRSLISEGLKRSFSLRGTQDEHAAELREFCIAPSP
eukprot:3000141-Rhodomonas_salina.1